MVVVRFLSLLGLLATPVGPFSEFERREVATGPLYSRGWSEGEIRWAEESLPRSVDRVERRLGRDLGRKFTTVLVHGSQELDRVVEALGGQPPGPMVRGVAFPARMVIVVRGDLIRLPTTAAPTTRTLSHEIAHLVLHRLGGELPRWLDEGAAEWASGGEIDPRAEAQLALLARTRSLYRLETLAKRFPPGHHPTTVAYRQSRLFIEHIVEVHGRAALVELLDRVEAREPPEEVLEAVTGVALPVLEERFRAWVAARRSLLEGLASYVSVWTIAALLALVAIVRYVLRRRRLLRELAGADADEGPDGPEGSSPEEPRPRGAMPGE